jgi:hypothetical protein
MKRCWDPSCHPSFLSLTVPQETRRATKLMLLVITILNCAGQWVPSNWEIVSGPEEEEGRKKQPLWKMGSVVLRRKSSVGFGATFL